MAREEQDREDLMREATALVERAELAIPAFAEHVFAGFRRDGCMSVYFGPDAAVHFNTRSQLRRAYRDGKLYKAERSRLSSLDRQRTEPEVQLIRHDLTDAETAEFLALTRRELDAVRDSLSSGDFRLIAEVPEDAGVVSRVQQWLDGLGAPLETADSPHAK